MIRDQPVYRRQAFAQGLAACGYEVRFEHPTGQRPGDILVTWNRYASVEQIADRFEAQGGVVLVAENGYINGRHDGGDYYALAIAGHNGSGRWNPGGPERWHALGVELKPWRVTGDHILVAPSRTFGRRGTVMPSSWPDDVTRRLQEVTDRPIRLRQHPANGRPAVPLEDDLWNCWAVVIWHSTVGIKALLEGIPVVCEAPYWICKRAAWKPVGQELPYQNEAAQVFRELEFRRLAWAQFSVAEISSGMPFKHLLQRHIIDGPTQCSSTEPALTTSSL